MTAKVRKFQPDDASAVSDLIRLTMEQSNGTDYPMERLRPLIDYFSPDKVAMLNEERFCLVAEVTGRIVGTAAIEGQQICTFFVHPDLQRQGIGTDLLAGLENAAPTLGLNQLLVQASLTGALFYERHGYARTGKVIDGTAGPQIEMQKQVNPGQRLPTAN